jgi:glucose-1-phosphate adenylyltransferase
MGAFDYEHGMVNHESGGPLGIVKNCLIKQTMVYKNVRIGDGVIISPEGKPVDEVTDLYWIRDGIMVIPKNTVIPSGTVL